MNLLLRNVSMYRYYDMLTPANVSPNPISGALEGSEIITKRARQYLTG